MQHTARYLPPLPPSQATGALAACQGSVERAADWLFSRDDVDAAVEAALAPPSAAGECLLSAACLGSMCPKCKAKRGGGAGPSTAGNCLLATHL